MVNKKIINVFHLRQAKNKKKIINNDDNDDDDEECYEYK